MLIQIFKVTYIPQNPYGPGFTGGNIPNAKMCMLDLLNLMVALNIAFRNSLFQVHTHKTFFSLLHGFLWRKSTRSEQSG